jgi:hypothetical protein
MIVYLNSTTTKSTKTPGPREIRPFVSRMKGKKRDGDGGEKLNI